MLFRSVSQSRYDRRSWGMNIPSDFAEKHFGMLVTWVLESDVLLFQSTPMLESIKSQSPSPKLWRNEHYRFSIASSPEFNRFSKPELWSNSRKIELSLQRYHMVSIHHVVDDAHFLSVGEKNYSDKHSPTSHSALYRTIRRMLAFAFGSRFPRLRL